MDNMADAGGSNAAASQTGVPNKVVEAAMDVQASSDENTGNGLKRAREGDVWGGEGSLDRGAAPSGPTVAAANGGQASTSPKLHKSDGQGIPNEGAYFVLHCLEYCVLFHTAPVTHPCLSFHHSNKI